MSLFNNMCINDSFFKGCKLINMYSNLCRNKSKTDSVETPLWIISYLKTNFFKNEVMFDPTPYNPSFCPKKNRCALTQDWFSPSYVNPPYSNVKKFVERANQQFLEHNIKSILLVKADVICTKYFKKIFKNTHVKFLSVRIKFENYKFKAPFTSCLIFFGYLKKNTFEVL